MVIERNSVGCPGPHDGVFLILIENVDLFEDGISLIDIINALQARRAGTDLVRLRRIRLSDDIRSANLLTVDVIIGIRLIVDGRGNELRPCFPGGIAPLHQNAQTAGIAAFHEEILGNGIEFLLRDGGIGDLKSGLLTKQQLHLGIAILGIAHHPERSVRIR